ncbi:MAG: hypothetical protein ACFFCW_47630 [Candidatus Hodarchaeota archaeon]
MKKNISMVNALVFFAYPLVHLFDLLIDTVLYWYYYRTIFKYDIDPYSGSHILAYFDYMPYNPFFFIAAKFSISMFLVFLILYLAKKRSLKIAMPMYTLSSLGLVYYSYQFVSELFWGTELLRSIVFMCLIGVCALIIFLFFNNKFSVFPKLYFGRKLNFSNKLLVSFMSLFPFFAFVCLYNVFISRSFPYVSFFVFPLCVLFFFALQLRKINSTDLVFNPSWKLIVRYSILGLFSTILGVLL